MSTILASASRSRVLRRVVVAMLLAFPSSCGGGGGSQPAPSILTVVSVDHPLDPAAPALFAVAGTAFPGAAGSPVTVRLTASDRLALATCGEAELTVAGTLVSATSVEATLPSFALTRDVLATVTLDFAGGISATSAAPIASLVGTPDESLDQDLDGVLDACDPKTYAFEAEAVGERPAGT